MPELTRRNMLVDAFGLAGLAAVSACRGTTAVPVSGESVRCADALRGNVSRGSSPPA